MCVCARARRQPLQKLSIKTEPGPLPHSKLLQPPTPPSPLPQAVVLACAGFLFFRVEQVAVQRSILSSSHVSETNEELRIKNEALEDAKKKLEKDEDE